MKLVVNSKRLYFLLLALCSIGIGLQIVLYQVAIIALILHWIFTFEYKQKIHKIRGNNFMLGWMALFFLYAGSLFWTDNIPFALTDLLLKSPLFILPLVIGSQDKLTTRQANSILLSFALSILALNLFCTVNAYFSYLKTNELSHFYYHRFTVNMHTAYQAMFTCFSVAILIYLRLKDKFIENWVMYFGVIVQLIFILLLSSRMQILIMMALTPTYFLLSYYKKKKLYLGIIYTLIVFGLAKGIMSAPSSLNYRYKQTVTHISSIGVDSDNSDPRKFIWENGLTLIKENWIFGTGIGDVKKVLVDRYALRILDNPISASLMDSTINSLEANTSLVESLKNKSLSSETTYDYQLNQYAENSLKRRNIRYKSFVAKGYNFHNQYLQIFGTIGIFGLLLLLYLFVNSFFLFIKKASYLPATFLFIVGSSFLTESMLERQAGVSFIVFFFMILVAFKYQNKPS
jgi:O-antigen ligase